MEYIKKFFKDLKVHHYVVFALILVIGIFNAVTALAPQIKQHQTEKSIESSFEDYWTNTREQQLKSFGLSTDEKTKELEWEQFKERNASQQKAIIIEDRIEEIKKEFREWWEIKGGKEQFSKEHGYYPKERDFQKEQHDWIKKYTDKFLRYSMAFTPAEENYGALVYCWILFPSLLSFLIFAGFFGMAYMQLSRRWGIPVVVGIFLGLAIVGGVFPMILTGTSFFDHYVADRYMGASIALTFLLGATAYGLTKDAVNKMVRIICFVGLILDALVNWFVNPGIFGAVAITSFVAFGLGALAGTKIPNRRKSLKEIKASALEERLRANAAKNPMAERQAKTRALIQAGFEAAKKSEYENAQRILSQALNALLQEHPVDEAAVQKLAEQMTSPNFFIEIPNYQWLEWGEVAKTKNSLKAALILLEKGLNIETDIPMARRTLYHIGEIRVNKHWDLEDAVSKLNKVIELGSNDILAMQSRRMLERAEKMLEAENPKPANNAAEEVPDDTDESI